MASTRKAVAVLRGKLWSREEVDLKDLRMTVRLKLHLEFIEHILYVRHYAIAVSFLLDHLIYSSTQTS